MKKSFHVVSLSALLLAFAVSTAWADELELSGDGSRRSAGVPVTGSHTITIPDGVTFIELGSSDVKQAMNSSVTLTAPEGKTLLVLDGEYEGFVRENAGDLERFSTDSMFVYDGANSNASELFKAARGAGLGLLNSSGQNLTIHYKENEAKGWWFTSLWFSLRVFVVDPSTPHSVTISDDCVDNGSVDMPNSAAANDLVTLTVTPDEGYVLKKVGIGYANSGNYLESEFPLTENVWFPGNEVTFTMPSMDVKVCPEFISTSELQNGLVVDIPVDRPLRMNIPSGVESFKVNGGGADNDLSKPVVLTAPEAYLFEVDDANSDYGENGLFAYNGVVEDGYYNRADLMQGVTSGRNLTLFYTSRGEGFRRTINLIPNEEHDIIVAPSVGDGSVTISPVSGRAYAGDTITVTGAAADGYVFNGIVVYDEYRSQLLGAVDDAWYKGEAKFVMPLSNVLIEPIFIEEYEDVFKVKIPKSDTLRVTIPENIAYISVFDDGGPGDFYSNRANGVLILTAPDGYTLVTGGGVNFYDENDSLYIYEGAGVSENVLAKMSNDDDIYDENELYSTGRSLTYHLKSDGQGNASGVWMYVTVLKQTILPAVVISDTKYWVEARIDGNYTGNETVDIPDPISVDEINYNRVFSPGVPSTITLPFTLPEGTTINADFYTLSSVLPDGRKWKATMTYIGDGNLPQPNTPYAIIPENDYLEFSFGGTATLQTKAKDTVKVSDGDWLFVGTYSYKKWTSNDGELGLAYAFAATDNVGGAKKGKFGKISAGASANPFRAYLRKKDASVQLPPQQNSPAALGTYYSVSFVPEGAIEVEFVKASIDGSGEGTTVAKGLWNVRTGEFKMLRTYDIKGRKLNGTPKTRGAYYGKKVLKK